MTSKTIRLLTLFASVCTIFVVTQIAFSKASPQTQERSIHQTESRWTWNHRDTETRLEVSIRGKVEFSDDYKDIKSITDDGSIRIIDERGGVTRKFEASATADGIKRTYWFEGREQPLNDDARAWLAKVLQDTVVQGGYDAKPRVKRILNERGPAGVLDEISNLKGDYVKKIYFEELIKSAQLDQKTSHRAIEQAGREIKSDYEKSNVLIKLGENYLADSRAHEAYLAALSTIRSDYERGRVLSSLLKKDNVSKESLVFAARSAAQMSSDYEKAQVLMKISAASAGDQAVGHAMLETARTIKSDYDKANVLIKISATSAGDQKVRDDLVETARTIKSDYDRGRVLNAVFK